MHFLDWLAAGLNLHPAPFPERPMPGGDLKWDTAAIGVA
jgi:hypothetical protein